MFLNKDRFKMDFWPNLTRFGLPKGSQKAPKTSPKRTQDESKIESNIKAKKWSKNGRPRAPWRALTVDVRGPRCPLEGVGGGSTKQPKDQHWRSSTPQGSASYARRIQTLICFPVHGITDLKHRVTNWVRGLQGGTGWLMQPCSSQDQLSFRTAAGSDGSHAMTSQASYWKTTGHRVPTKEIIYIYIYVYIIYIYIYMWPSFFIR